MTGLKKRILSVMTSVCMLAGAMSVMSITASAKSIGDVQMMKAYWIKNNATGQYLTMNNTYISDSNNGMTVEALDPSNTKQQFYINKDSSQPSGSGYGYYTLTSVYAQGFCVAGEKNPINNAGRVFASSNIFTRWYIADSADGSVTISYDTYQSDKMVANVDYGTDARKVWLAGYMSGNSNDQWTLEAVEDGYTPPTFQMGYCYIRNTLGQYLSYSGTAAVGTQLTVSSTPRAWNITKTGEQLFISVPGTDLYLMPENGPAVLGQNPSKGFYSNQFDAGHFVLMTPMLSEDDYISLLQTDAHGNVILVGSPPSVGSYGWVSIPV